MADDYDPLSGPTPASQYSLYEMGSNDPMAYFDSLTGGDENISSVTFNVIDEHGNVTTKFMPGQTTFEPVVLLRAMDKYSKDPKNLFYDAVLNKYIKVRRNYSVSMNDSKGNPLVWWHLYNAIPIAISGFSFNAPREAYYTDFEITLQAESIYIQFEPISDDPLP